MKMEFRRNFLLNQMGYRRLDQCLKFLRGNFDYNYLKKFEKFIDQGIHD